MSNSVPTNEYSSIGLSPGIDTIINHLKTLARTECWSDDEDFEIDNFAAGNIDDAFYGGWSAGKIELARTLLTSFGIGWE